MVFEYICPFCGNKFKIGYDPVKNINYPDYSVELRYEAHDANDTIQTNYVQICNKCYDKMNGEIMIKERRIKSEQPKFP